MTTIGLTFAFLWFFVLAIGVPHPIQEADKNTKCAFSLSPTGYLVVNRTISVPGECMSVTCQSDLTISGLTCPTHFVFPGCYLTELDHFEQYPRCCPQLICNFVDFAYVSDYQQNYN